MAFSSATMLSSIAPFLSPSSITFIDEVMSRAKAAAAAVISISIAVSSSFARFLGANCSWSPPIDRSATNASRRTLVRAVGDGVTNDIGSSEMRDDGADFFCGVPTLGSPGALSLFSYIFGPGISACELSILTLESEDLLLPNNISMIVMPTATYENWNLLELREPNCCNRCKENQREDCQPTTQDRQRYQVDDGKARIGKE
mmetsp:Transcript_32937/g.69327  ORF Transcript_32937/g.69327 Transcript_32937/m.69327 type:complete len:202 (-) Transcript_32937:65-670(-)